MARLETSGLALVQLPPWWRQRSRFRREGEWRGRHQASLGVPSRVCRRPLDELGLAVLGLILLLVAGTVLLAMDDTLARKRDLKVFGVGMHRAGFASRHDPLLSSRRTAVTN